jgi:hypothetical protein
MIRTKPARRAEDAKDVERLFLELYGADILGDMTDVETPAHARRVVRDWVDRYAQFTRENQEALCAAT